MPNCHQVPCTLLAYCLHPLGTACTHAGEILGKKDLGKALPPPPPSPPSFLCGRKASDLLSAIRQVVVSWYSGTFRQNISCPSAGERPTGATSVPTRSPAASVLWWRLQHPCVWLCKSLSSSVQSSSGAKCRSAKLGSWYNKVVGKGILQIKSVLCGSPPSLQPAPQHQPAYTQFRQTRIS